jgi:GxxExxY protein
MGELLHKEITGKILGCAFDVHSFLGNGFQEVIYQRALSIEFKAANLSFKRELEMPIYYKNSNQRIGLRRVDFLVEDKVLVEIKAVSALQDVHLAQILNYIKVYKLGIGLLINFGSKSIEYKRVIKTDR